MRSTRLAAAANSPMHALDVVLGHRVRHGPPRVVGNRRRRLRRPATVFLGQDRLAASGRRRGRAFTASMRELYAELGDAILTAEIVHALERGLVVVRIHAGAFRRDAALRIDVGHLAHHQSRGAERHIAEMHQVPVVGRAVVGIVLAHGRDHDPVRQGQTAHGDGREQDASHWEDFLSVRKLFLRLRMILAETRFSSPIGAENMPCGIMR